MLAITYRRGAIIIRDPDTDREAVLIHGKVYVDGQERTAADLKVSTDPFYKEVECRLD